MSGVQVGVDLRRGRARDGTIVGLAILVLVASPFAALAHGPSVGGASAADHGWSSATAASVTAPSALSATASTAVTPAAGVFQPNCYKIDTTVCVSILNSTETNIIPPSGSFVSTQQPNASSDITLAIKSHTKLDWPNALHSGPLSPIALNVTARLWNGDPFYSVDDGTVWHANGPTWWTALPQDTSNLTYPYWYTVTFNAHGSGGAPNFFPGMTVSWWIYLTYNSSTNGGYTHHLSPMFQFTYSGAWPYSPYPGSGQYVGSGATFEDINLTVSPRNPNFNDSVQLVLNTTQADVLSNATIGTGTYVDVTEVASNGTPIAASTFLFPVLVTNGFGAVSTTVAIPASYSQVEGAIVTYTLSVRDVSNDLLVTPPASYTVGGNGSFLSGIFPDDLDLATTPQALLAEPVGAVQVAPGAPVNLTLTSRNAGTSISAAEAVYTLSYPLLHETILLRAPLTRVTSTQFIGSIPGMPLGSFVNFSVYAWDFSQRLEISPELGYYTPDLQTEVPVVPGNASFFYVFVYDNGSGAWVSGAKVQIEGLGGVYNSLTNTTAGIAYPNQTFAPFTPLLLSANASYRVTVTDPQFTSAIGVSVLALHSMTARQTLQTGSNYWVVQEGNAVVFWLNATAPPPALAPSNGGGSVSLAAVLGAVGVTAVTVPLVLWFRQIRARRKAEERRVTL